MNGRAQRYAPYNSLEQIETANRCRLRTLSPTPTQTMRVVLEGNRHIIVKEERTKDCNALLADMRQLEQELASANAHKLNVERKLEAVHCALKLTAYGQQAAVLTSYSPTALQTPPSPPLPAPPSNQRKESTPPRLQVACKVRVPLVSPDGSVRKVLVDCGETFRLAGGGGGDGGSNGCFVDVDATDTESEEQEAKAAEEPIEEKVQPSVQAGANNFTVTLSGPNGDAGGRDFEYEDSMDDELAYD